jgi:hypothetical protein
MKFLYEKDNGTEIGFHLSIYAELDDVLEEFQNFLRACGYTIEYDKVLAIVEMDKDE